MNTNKIYISIIAIAVITLAGLFYPTPTRMWEKQLKLYQSQINSYSGESQKLINDIIIKKEQIKTLSGQIRDNNNQLNLIENNTEKLQLCIDAKSLDCNSSSKSAMLSLMPKASATTNDESSTEIIREKIIVAPTVKVKAITNGKITDLYANNPGPDECKDFTNTPTRIVLHYTATSSKLTATQILQSHLKKFGMEHYAGYHYIVDDNGNIYRTRPDNCNAAAEPVANKDGIHIAFIGDDKPNQSQIDSMVWLTKDVGNRLKISTKNVTAHADIAAKNHKESLDYMFGGYDAFQKLIRLTQMITRDGKQMDALTYAYHAWGDIDFILTIQAESQFNPESRGDINVPNQ